MSDLEHQAVASGFPCTVSGMLCRHDRVSPARSDNAGAVLCTLGPQLCQATRTGMHLQQLA